MVVVMVVEVVVVEVVLVCSNNVVRAADTVALLTDSWPSEPPSQYRDVREERSQLRTLSGVWTPPHLGRLLLSPPVYLQSLTSTSSITQLTEAF